MGPLDGRNVGVGNGFARQGSHINDTSFPKRRIVMLFLRVIATASLPLIMACDTNEGWIVVRNDTGRAITEVHIDPCGVEEPGPDRTGSGAIAPGSSEGFRTALGCHQVYILTEDGFPGYWEVDLDRGARQVVLFARSSGAGS